MMCSMRITMTRDLRREREIAKGCGPLKTWSPIAERRPARSTARQSLEWLRQTERERAELAAAAGRVPGFDEVGQI